MNQTTKTLQERLAEIIAQTPPGEKLPAEPKLAKTLGVSRSSLREAMRAFEVRGVLLRKQGSGTYVMVPAEVIESGMEVLESIETQARRMGLAVSMGALHIQHRLPTEKERLALDVPADQPVVVVERSILLRERPIAYLVDVLPENVLSPEDLRGGFHGSVLDLLLARGNPPLGLSRCDIQAVPTPSEIAKHLGIQRGDALLLFESHLLSTEGRVVDYSLSYFLPGYFHFHVVRRVAG